MISRLLVIAGAGTYPELVVRGARSAGVGTVDVIAIKGSTARKTIAAADNVFRFSVYDVLSGMEFVASRKYDGIVLAGQVNPMSLFRGTFDATAREWLASMPVKNAHTIFGKVVSEFERRGVRVLPASSYMDGHRPGVGALTERTLSAAEEDDVRRGMEVAGDMGRHDVGQTVLVKSGMVLAVEAFEGTNAAIRRAGRLGHGSVLCKAARAGHDWRFDIPVAGLKTLKEMHKARVTALAFQAGRLLLLDRDKVVDYANRHSIAIVGVESGLAPAPLRPEDAK